MIAGIFRFLFLRSSFASNVSVYELMFKGVYMEDKCLQSIRDQATVVSEPKTESPTRILCGALSLALSCKVWPGRVLL